MLRRSPYLLLSLLLVLVAFDLVGAADPEKLRSIAEGLTRSKGDFVFDALPPSTANASFESVEVSARTEKNMRLEGTAMRSLGVSLRGWKIGPCVGVGPFSSGTAGLFQLFPAAASDKGSSPGLIWTQVAATNAVAPGSKEAKATTRAVKPGQAVALWPSLVQIVRNDGCAAAEGVLFLEGDGDELAWPLADFLIEFPSESFEAGAAGKVREALNGGNGMSWVDKACARRCGIDADAKKAPAEAAAEDKKKKP